jgi:hypothetical protein
MDFSMARGSMMRAKNTTPPRQNPRRYCPERGYVNFRGGVGGQHHQQHHHPAKQALAHLSLVFRHGLVVLVVYFSNFFVKKDIYQKERRRRRKKVENNTTNTTILGGKSSKTLARVSVQRGGVGGGVALRRKFTFAPPALAAVGAPGVVVLLVPTPPKTRKNGESA